MPRQPSSNRSSGHVSRRVRDLDDSDGPAEPSRKSKRVSKPVKPSKPSKHTKPGKPGKPGKPSKQSYKIRPTTAAFRIHANAFRTNLAFVETQMRKDKIRDYTWHIPAGEPNVIEIIARVWSSYANMSVPKWNKLGVAILALSPPRFKDVLVISPALVPITTHYALNYLDMDVKKVDELCEHTKNVSPPLPYSSLFLKLTPNPAGIRQVSSQSFSRQKAQSLGTPTDIHSSLVRFSHGCRIHHASPPYNAGFIWPHGPHTRTDDGSIPAGTGGIGARTQCIRTTTHPQLSCQSRASHI